MKKTLLLLGLLVFGCKQEATLSNDNVAASDIPLKYAEGFTISKVGDHKLITVNRPWPEADITFNYLVLNEETDSNQVLEQESYDEVISTPLNHIVVTSTTHIPALEMLGVADLLVGFPGCDYISSEYTRKRINQGEVKELGKNEGINTEVLIESNPDLIISFGVEGANKSMETIKRAGIPVIYNGDWVEDSPLAKAEWIKFFGVIFNKEAKADSLFADIEKNYLEAKQIASEVEIKPTIMSGALHKDVWYLPSGSSPEAQFLKDANVNYLWADSSGQGSLSLSFETVLDKAHDADIWLSPSYYKTIDDLRSANPHYSEFRPFEEKNIFSFSNTVGEKGGVLYYELGVSRPDLVLKDIIKICHPDLLPNYDPFFFKPLK